MKPVVALLLWTLSFTTVSAWPIFEDTYGIPANPNFADLADQVVLARRDESSMTLAQKQRKLENLRLRIEAKIEQFPDDPLIWFLSGLNHNNLAEIRFLIVFEELGQEKAAADIEVSNFNIARSRAYENAIRLDGEKPHRLSSTIYAAMGYGLSNRQKIKTYSRELELGSPAENESNEWFMHWAKIDALVQDRKLEEAEQALADLKQLLKQKNKSESAYANIVKKAEAQVLAERDTVEKRKILPVSQSLPESTQIHSNESSWGWQAWLVTGIGVFTFVFVLVAAIYLRKN